MHLTIGITNTEARYPNYPLWIKGNDDIEIIKLDAENFDDIKKCDGIVLSGGIDTHPKFYKNERLNYPLAPSTFNEQRDEFELKVFNYTQEKKIPVLAICRGMQLVNVALGGDLIQDLEENKKQDHRRHNDVDGIHQITVAKGSLLYQITGTDTGTINSAHHQAFGKIANDLKVTAYSPDNVAEAAEWKNKEHKPFLLCVQWHPERLAQEQPDNPFTKNIREHFLKEILKTKTLNSNY
jgi:putative glutamine amidotransferase